MTETLDRSDSLTTPAQAHVPPNPEGWCGCGCGKKTNRAKQDIFSAGIKYKRGDHLRFLVGHANHLRRDIVSKRADAETRQESWERFIRAKSGAASPAPHSEDLYLEQRQEQLEQQRRQNIIDWHRHYKMLAVLLQGQAQRAEEQAQKLLAKLEAEVEA